MAKHPHSDRHAEAVPEPHPGGHPRLLIRQAPAPGLRTVDDVRRDVGAGFARQLWDMLLAEAEADLRRDPYLPGSPCEGRSAANVALANPDYTIVSAACKRIKRGGLLWLLTGQRRFVADALRQMDVLFDTAEWPAWPDRAHSTKGLVADLRTGQFMRAFGYAYDWLHDGLSAAERDWIVRNLDRRGIGPYLEEVAKGTWFTGTGRLNNWCTCIVGGAGTAAMALGEAHPESARVLNHALKVFERYLGVFGPEGEFNESVGYSGAVHFPVEFYSTYRTHTGGGDNRAGSSPFTDFCRWYMHFIVPPGRTAAFGDSHIDAGPSTTMLAAVAAAARDPVLQWFYLQHAGAGPRGDLALELLAFDPTLEPLSPEGRVPRGRAYRGHSANWSSRSDWDPRAAACVVYGKGGHGMEGHGNHDAGQVCIDAFGERLIVDLGALSYPRDFFGPNRWEYYNASVRGHNVLMFGGREMKAEADARAGLIDFGFEDGRGGYWIGDMAALYDGALSVRRAIIHLQPGVVAVLDEAELAAEDAISLRWHTADRCAPDAHGAFTVRSGDVALAGRVLRLDGAAPHFGRGEHAYSAPYDHDRYDRPLEQKRESFVEARLRAKRCRLLSVFCVFAPAERPQAWTLEQGALRIRCDAADVCVTASDSTLCARDLTGGKEWRAELPPLRV